MIRNCYVEEYGDTATNIEVEPSAIEIINETMTSIKYHDFLLSVYCDRIDTLDTSSIERMSYFAGQGNFEIVNSMLMSSVSPNDKYCSCPPIVTAVRNNREDVVKLLLDSNSVFEFNNQYDLDAMHIAAANGYIGIIKRLLTYTDNVNTKYMDDATPLHFAVVFGHTDVVQLLLENGADVQSKLDGRISALQLAAIGKNIAIVELRLQHNANLSWKTNDKWSALYYAEEMWNIEVIKLLLTKMQKDELPES